MSGFNDLQNLLNAGMRAADKISREDHRQGLEDTERVSKELSSEDKAFRKELQKLSSADTRFELHEMECPHCGATMKPNDFAKMSQALGAIECPYCGSEIVLDDKLKDAEVIQKSYLEKKKVDNEARRIKVEEDYQKTQDTLNTLNAINKGINNIRIGCGLAIIALILVIVLIIIF